MIASAICVLLTLVVGGSTRLTESGLSITEWKPVSGVLPPLSADAWDEAYQAYLKIPEAQSVHRGITLPQFRTLFWWEWAHRLVARIAGLVMALPFLWLLIRRRIPPGWGLRLGALPVLTLAQGALGWYMVSSGLSERTDVSQYRLVAHLLLALAIYVLAVRYVLVLQGAPRFRWSPPHRLAAMVLITIMSGGFVAGLDAGRIYNSFPLMGERLVPPGYAQLEPEWRNWFENAAAVQFNHRVLAVLTLVFALYVARRGSRSSPRGTALLLTGVVAIGQVVLGIATLVSSVPLGLAAAHQLGAVALLTVSMIAAGAPDRTYASAAATVSSAARTAAPQAAGS